jgi:hypothetical protein
LINCHFESYSFVLSRWFSQALEEWKKLAKNIKGRIVARKRRVEMFYTTDSYKMKTVPVCIRRRRKKFNTHF